MLGKRLINSNDAAGAACASDEVDILGDGSGVALYQLNWDGSDMSGNYDGTATDVSFVNGKIDSAGSFNGSSSFVNLGQQNQFSNSEVSFSVWIKPSSFSNSSRVILASTNGGSFAEDDFAIYFRDNNVSGYIGTEVGQSSSIYEAKNTNTTPISINEWTHIVLTFDTTLGTNITKVFINGVSQSLTNTYPPGGTFSGNILDSTLNLNIGKRNISGTPLFFNGDIDQVRIFNTTLTQANVDTLYAETACVKTCTTDTPQLVSDCIAYYKLDGNADDSNGTATVYDGTPTDVSWTQGRLGSAGGFNGSSSYISGLNNIIPATNTDFSFSCWFNMASSFSSNYKSIVGGIGTDSLRVIIEYSSSNNYIFSITRGYGGNIYVYKTTATTLYPSIWYNLICTYDSNSNTVNVYLDNLLINAPFSLSASGSINTNLLLGTYRTDVGFSYWNGSIDQVRIYDRAITAEEVTTLYNEVACPSGLNFNPVLFPASTSSSPINIGGVGFQPDFVWIKYRGLPAEAHYLFDSIRGGKLLYGNQTSPENPTTYLSSYNNDGFTLVNNLINRTGSEGVVAWCWKAGGDAVTNTDGTITSDVSANVDAGFSIVEYTAGGAANVGHGLSQAPELIITKNLDISEQWFVYAEPVGTQKFLGLNTTTAATPNSGTYTSITDSTFTNLISSTSRTYINYCFHSVAGYQKIGSYTGNGSFSGNTISTVIGGDSGFEPAFVMIKCTTVADQWIIFDNKRGVVSNNTDTYLLANLSQAEADLSNGDSIDFLTNGFKVIGDGRYFNENGETYIYLAIA